MSRFAQSKLAAGLQEIISKRREEVGLYAEVVEWLRLPSSGRLLEVGCGSGLQLKGVSEISPGLELFGLDLSGAAIRNAKRNLESTGIDLREGSIESTDYEGDFFDVVTCFTSMSYWKNLVACFDETYRILKPGGSAQFIEPQEDIDIDEVVETLKANLSDKSRLRRFVAVNFNRLALQGGRRIGLKLYAMKEIEEIATKSRFGGAERIERVSLQNLPIFMLIVVRKPDTASD